MEDKAGIGYILIEPLQATLCCHLIDPTLVVKDRQTMRHTTLRGGGGRWGIPSPQAQELLSDD